MAFTTQLNLIDSKFCQSSGTLTLSGDTRIASVGTIQYLTDQSSSYVARSVVDAAYVTGQTADLQADIDYLSGETVLRLVISDFNIYSGLTDTRITAIEDDVTFLGVFSGDTVADLAFISAQTVTNTDDIATITGLAITGATNGLNKNGQDVELGGTLSKLTVIDTVGNTFSIKCGTLNQLHIHPNQVILHSVFGGKNAGVTATAGGGGYSATMKADSRRIDINDEMSSQYNGICINNSTGVVGCESILFLSDTGTTFTDDICDQGINYAACYHTNYTDRTLVDKEYVDLCAGGSGVQSANNGLTKTGTNVTLGGALTGDTTINLDGNDLFFNTNPVKYTGDYSGQYVARSIPDAHYVTGLTDGLQTQIDSNDADIVYLSGQTDTKLNIDDFNTYSGDTDTRITAIEEDITFLSVFSGDTVADLAYISGQTDANIADISNLGAISGITNVSITGATNGLCKYDTHNVCLGGSLSTPVAIDINGESFVITDDNGPGLEYAANYCDYFLDRSLVDKAYVDAASGGIGGNNGLSRDGDNIVLGGTLTGATIVDADGYDLCLCDGNCLTSIGLCASTSVAFLKVNDVSSCETKLSVHIDYIEGRSNSTSFQGFKYVTSFDADVNDKLLNSIPDVGYVTGLTDGLQTQIDGNDADILYLSGQTALKLNITDFDTYSGDTQTTLTDLRTDVNAVSGQTDTNTTNIATNVSDISYITGLAITGASNGLTKSGQDAHLGGTLTNDVIIDAQGTYNLVLGGTGAAGLGALTVRATTIRFSGYTSAQNLDINNALGAGSSLNTIEDAAATLSSDDRAIATSAAIKSYVDASTGGIGADNGLTKDGANIVLGGALTGDTNIDINNHALTITDTSGAGIEYSDDYSATFVARSLVDAAYVTGLTNGLQEDIDYISGQTLTITEFNSYTATTDTRIDGIETDIQLVSGVTTTNTANIATNVNDIQLVSGVTTQNTTDISLVSGVTTTNTANIATNVNDIQLVSGVTTTNTANIATNVNDIQLVSGATTANTTNITQNADDITYITGIALTGVTNGLSENNQVVELGGALTKNTYITSTAWIFDITTTNPSSQIALHSAGSLYMCGGGTMFLAGGAPSSGGTLCLGGSNNDIVLQDRRSGADQVGLEYAGCYHTNYSDRSLVDKEYVDSATGGIGAASGLHRDGANIVLGGALTGNTDISGTDTLTISAPLVGSDVQSLTFDEAPTVTQTEGMLFYSGCSLNFVREIAGVCLQIGEESVIRVTNQTGNLITNGAAVYIPGALDGIPTVAKSSASNFTGARFVGLLTQDIADNNEGYITTDGTVHNLDTSAWTVGDAIWVSTTAGELTNVRPTYPDSSTLVGIVTVDHSDDGEILVRSNNIPDHVEISTFTGYTAATQTELDLKLYITDFNAYTGTTDTRLEDIEEVTDVALTGATNGLCVTGRDVYLGGALTEATTISGAFNLTLASTCDTQIRTVANSINVDAQSNGLLALKSQSGTLTGPTSFSSAIGFSLDFDQSSGFIVYDNRTGSDQEGIRYASNYSTNFVDRSLVDKAYVDSVASGRATKESVLVATTGHSGLSGLTATVDGVTLSDTDRVLVKNQNDAQYNGIYSASTGVWGRTDDYDFTPAGEIANGDLIPVISGETNANTQWVLTTPDPVEVNDDLNFSLFSKLLQISGGDGIDITQSSGTDVISVDLANNSGLEFNSNALSVANEIAGSGLTWTAGVINVNACPNEATGTCIPVLFDAACNLVVDSDDFSYTTAENGLSKQGCNVVLGGALTGDTTVCGDSNVYDLSFTELDVLTLSSACGTVTTTDTFGLQYSTDYKSSFCDNSLVSKAYVDCQVTGGVLADNGLTKVVDTVIWGGALTGDTFVSLGTGRICMLDTSVVTVCSDCSYLNVSATSIDSYTCNDNSCVSQVDLNDDGTLSIVANNALTGLTITAAAVGAVYAGDYESNFVGRSLVTKTYVDTCAANELVGAENGLTKLGDNNIVLGGALTGDTTITGANYNLHLGTLGSALAELNLAATSVKLIATPATGAVTDAVLVWNSTDKIIKQIDATNLGEDNNRYSVTAITNSTINLTGTEFVVLVDANSNSVTVNLPATPTTGMAFKIKDTGGDALTNNITVVPNAGNIDGSSNAIINTNYGAMEIVYGGSEWKILSFVN